MREDVLHCEVGDISCFFYKNASFVLKKFANCEIIRTFAPYCLTKIKYYRYVFRRKEC